MPDFQARKHQNQTSQEPPGFRHGEAQANGFYTKFCDLCFICFYLKRRIYSKGVKYSCISGLPYTANGSIDKQSISVTDLGGWQYDDDTNKWEISPTVTMEISGGSSLVKLEQNNGLFAIEYPQATSSKMFDVWIAGSGFYKIQVD